jgi:deazaflavin-dependent oxidoreductase (nitroreductase family)
LTTPSESAEFLYLTTVGRRTARSHTVEMWYVEHEGSHYLISELFDRADWVRNIASNPNVSVRLGGVETLAAGRALDNESDEPLIAAIKRQFDDKYGWSNGLVVQLCPARIRA